LAIAGAVLAGAGAVAAARGGVPAHRPSRAASDEPGDELRVSTRGWQTDFTKHSVPLGEITAGGPPRDGIPPIDQPTYVAIAEADGWLEAKTPVIALAVETAPGTLVARAYPLEIMVWHEIVNDVLTDRPLLVTFCPLCNTALACDRVLDPDGPRFDFGTTGNLRHSDLVMWDRQTESWWQQLTGEAIVGELTGRVLPPVPAQILGWQAFKAAYPGGDVLSRETGFDRPYGNNPYPGYDDIDAAPFLFAGEADGRLPAMERVVGLVIGEEAAAYPLPALADQGAVNDRVGGQEVAIFVTPGARSAVDTRTIAEGRDVGQAGVFRRTLDGRSLTFRPAGDGAFADVETGSIWDITGQAVAGELAGHRLAALPHTVVFWFAWAAAYPTTRLWMAGGN
jgi:hypothetical protein